MCDLNERMFGRGVLNVQKNDLYNHDYDADHSDDSTDECFSSWIRK